MSDSGIIELLYSDDEHSEPDILPVRLSIGSMQHPVELDNSESDASVNQSSVSNLKWASVLANTPSEMEEDDRIEDNGQGGQTTNLNRIGLSETQGKSIEDAIYIMSDDDNDSTGNMNKSCSIGSVRKPSTTGFASRFFQLSGMLPSPITRRNRTTESPRLHRAAQNPCRPGKRHVVLGCTYESFVPLGRKDIASRLGERIKRKALVDSNRSHHNISSKKSNKRSRPSEPPSWIRGRNVSPDMSENPSNDQISVDCDNDRTKQVPEDPCKHEGSPHDVSADCIEEHQSDDERCDREESDEDCSVNRLRESSEEPSGDYESLWSTDSVNSGQTGAGSCDFGTFQSDGEREKDKTQSQYSLSDCDDLSASKTSESLMAVPINKRTISNVDLISSDNDEAGALLEVQPESKIAAILLSLTSEHGQEKTDPKVSVRLRDRQPTPGLLSKFTCDRTSEDFSTAIQGNEIRAKIFESEDNDNHCVRRTFRKIRKPSKHFTSHEKLDDCLAANDPWVRRTIRRKQRLARKGGHNDQKYVMHLVPHLTETALDANGIPSRKFTVHTCNDDSILYDFEVKVKRSNISDEAGLGAFLIFRGGRVLDPERSRLNHERKSQRTPVDPGTLEKLEARYQSGAGAIVTLTGKHLHGHNNSIWRVQTEVPLKARWMNRFVKIRLVGDHLHYDMDEDERLDLPCCPPGIGHLLMSTESEYIRDESIIFSPETVGNCSLLELGRYGPVLGEDRKRKADFDIKCFLFDQAPSAWCYGLRDQWFGCEQIVDITDDVTGQVHEEARKNPTIYVNEVGHNPDLIENVQISQVGGFVQYHIDIEHQMMIGDEIELLCNYQSYYETARERKGYGLQNLVGKEKSDNDQFSKMKRNFVERLGIIEMIVSLPPLELYYNLEFISTRILPGVEKALNVFAVDIANPSSSLGAKPAQLKARRRIHWLAKFYLRRIDEIAGFGFLGPLDGSSKAAVEEMRSKCREWIENMTWSDLLQPSGIAMISDPLMRNAFDCETLEEVLFCVHEHFKYPMDENLWCPIARDLLVQLCVEAFEHDLRFGGKPISENLAHSFLKCAYRSAELIRHCIKTQKHENLVFRSGAEGSWSVKNSPANRLVLSAGSALLNSTVLKGAVSSLNDLHVNKDPEGVEESKRMHWSDLEQSCDEPIVVAFHSGRGALEAIPRRPEAVKEKNEAIHELWYIVWQVVYPVNAIFTGLVKEMSTTCSPSMIENFLKELCGGLNIALDYARAAVAVGIRDDLASPQMTFTPRAMIRVGSKRQARSKSTGGPKPMKSKLNPKALESRKQYTNLAGHGSIRSISMFFGVVWKAIAALGWTLIIGNRPTDFYFLPPGVRRGRKFGFKPRVDFFDSFKQVLTFLATDERWKNMDEVLECLFLYEGCKKFLAERKIKGEFNIDFIVEKVKSRALECSLQPRLNAPQHVIISSQHIPNVANSEGS